MGFARSKNNTKPAACPHYVWVGMDGYMVCKECGYTRLPNDGEDGGLPPLIRKRLEQQQGVDALNIRHDDRDGDV